MTTHFADTPLDALPWLTHSGSASTPVHEHGTGAASDLRYAGLAAVAAGLLASVWFLTGAFTPQPDLAVQPHSRAPSVIATPPLASAIRQTDNPLAATKPAAVDAEMSGSPDQPPAVDQAGSVAPARKKPAASTRSLGARALPAADQSPAADQALASDAGSPMTQDRLPSTESPVAAATLRQFRSTIGEAKDAARDVIRLGDRRRPGRDATAEEQTAYRLRQQNAEAAKTYLTYLDTLARSMKGTTSETVAQQSLAKARQTLGYLSTMEADSKASLR
ncbi:MAG: hypothetical protein NBV60_09505 [Erythrobacter sp.]|nr:hypothetical protein [Erythrobacter sp.]